jgi:hypothetical protein
MTTSLCFALLATGALVAPSPASAAPNVVIMGGAGQDALAVWIKPTGPKSAVMYVAEAFRDAGSDGLYSEALVARGTCSVRKGGRSTVIWCSASARPRPLSLEEFSVDPLLSSARLRFRAGRYTQSVSWKGARSGPEASGGFAAGEDGAMAGGGAYRFARATGILFGKSFTPKTRGLSFAFLSEGGTVGAFTLGGFSRSIGPDGLTRLAVRLRSRPVTSR